ncbi:MAG: hypothetical protein JW950_03985 [Deltaproteobacteria bacterium]|nr:hypothetical protein [Deltaproteobacteria bacterium]
MRAVFHFLYPSTTFAEMLLFFFALFLAGMEHHRVILMGFLGWLSEFWTNCLYEIVIARGFTEHLVAYFHCGLGILSLAWGIIIVSFLVILPLAGLVYETMHPRTLSLEQKRDLNYVIRFFFMIFALVGGFATATQIHAAYTSPEITDEVLFRLAISILFFLHRAAAFALAMMQSEYEREDEEILEYLFAERISDQQIRRPAALLAMAAGGILYLMLRRDGAYVLTSVLMTYIYGSILLQIFAFLMDRFRLKK